MDIKSLINELNYFTELYDKGISKITDKDWDEMYFLLKKEEEKTGIIYPNSPTQKIHYENVSELKKVKHDHPMLSLDKTKDIKEIINFLKGQPFVAMFKMDGLTCSLTYEEGKLIKAETRGNGVEGEDILHNAKVIKNIPQTISYLDRLVVDGEIICRKDDFIPFKEKYKNPRNFAAGSIRLLSSKECEKRNLSFIAWDVIEGFPATNEFWKKLDKLHYVLGFDIVPIVCDRQWPDEALEVIKENFKKEYEIYPIDGYVFKFNDIEYGKKQGQTEHHLKNAIALKEYDETYDTRLKYIDWTMGRTGVLTPIAVFDPIEINETVVERASLHNVSIMRELLGDCAYVGEPLKVAKMNMIIPQVIEAGPKYDYGYVIAHGGVSANDVIEKCPICGKSVSYKASNDGIINVYCENPNCNGKLVNTLDHFFGKKGLNIKGLSKATFEKFVDWGWVNSTIDVFFICNHKEELAEKPGFGVKSMLKILMAIENGKNTTLDAFISAAGIPLIGQAAAKDLANYFKTYEAFRKAVDNNWFSFCELPNFGIEMNNSLISFDYTEMDRISKILTFKEVVTNKNQKNKTLMGKTIVITGKLITVKNRNEFKKIIEEYGGKVASSISSKTDILINNDINSNSSKNKTAKNLGIPIISEKDFIKQYIEN